MDHEHHHHEGHSHHSSKENEASKKPDHTVAVPTGMAHHHAKHEVASEAHGHDKHAGHHTGDFLKRFWICLILTIPVLLLSHMIQDWFNFSIRFQGDKYILLGLGTMIYFYGGMPFLKGLVTEIKHKAIGMMTLVAL